ncbi:MAG TPA: hypothetical protein VNZ26_13435 [Vicinamibacterales bacterium]|nr:hypothetical protein [Vicinamibacterales bacterium]
MMGFFKALLGGVVPVFLAALVIEPASSRLEAQMLTYASGQNLAPAYEGWEEAADGSKYFIFGYMNRNWDEEINVPIGPDNNFNVGTPDQGQPTHFLPRRNRFVFKVKVPDNFTDKDELVWLLNAHGKPEKAFASLRIDYRIDDVVRASETGALGAGSSSPEIRANKPPTVKIVGAASYNAKVGDPVALAAVVTDDGIPKSRGAGLAGAAVSNPGSRRDPTTEGGPTPAGSSENPVRPNRAMLPPARVTVGKNVGLHLSWFVYRGEGTVTFDPTQIKAWEDTRAGANSPWAPIWVAPPMPQDGKITVRATFAQPGTYVLRALADDGALTSSEDVTVVVGR